MKVLIACEYSGVVREAFTKAGHSAVSCDLLPTDQPGVHYQGPIQNLLYTAEWDMMIAFPPCTHLAVSGARYFKDKREQQEDALDFVRQLMNAPIHYIAIENPVGVISSRIRRPDQIIQPYQFGEDASKKTCLWLKNLPKLAPTKYMQGRYINGKLRWSNQTDSGQNRLTPSPTRGHDRAKTYQGIADAMANQWGNLWGNQWGNL